MEECKAKTCLMTNLFVHKNVNSFTAILQSLFASEQTFLKASCSTGQNAKPKATKNVLLTIVQKFSKIPSVMADARLKDQVLHCVALFHLPVLSP